MSSAFYTWVVTRKAATTIPTPTTRCSANASSRSGNDEAEPGRGGRQLGIHQSLISQYERGYLRLHGALLVRLAQALGTTPDEILALKQPKTNGDGHTLDRRFLRRLQKIDRLSAHDKKILLGTIDAFLSKVS